MMRLMIVESPSKQRVIQKYLKDTDILVKSSVGHFRKLKKTGKRHYGFDTEDFIPEFSKDSKKNDIIKELRQLIKKADQVILSSDDDAEGWAIAWHLIDTFNIPKSKYIRVIYHEVTKDKILKAIENPVPFDQNLVDSALARRMLDRYVGFDLSKLARKGNGAPSAGRVQSALLKLIKDHDDIIDNFKPDIYWKLNLLVKYNKERIKFECTRDIESEERMNKLIELIETADPLKINEFKYNKKTRSSKPPFTTSSLQQEASGKLGFSSKRTMSIAQTLYSGVTIAGDQKGIITYLRTDNDVLSEEFVDKMESYMKDSKIKSKGFTSQSKKKNQSAQNAHEAIRPTDITLTPDYAKQFLSLDEYKLYELIWSRTLASRMEDLEYTNQNMKIIVDGETFTANYNRIDKKGYFSVYGKFENSNFGKLVEEKGNECLLLDIEAGEEETKPPKRYSESKLIKIMEKEGIGRPSTYANTISVIKDRGYVEKDGKSLKTTDMGKEVINTLDKYFPEIIDSKYTAKLESQLDEIQEGKKDRTEFLREAYNEFWDKYQDVYKNVTPEVRPVGRDCPDCGGQLIFRRGRYGEFIGCENYPTCKHIENKDGSVKAKPKKAGISCPKCGKDIVERTATRGKSKGSIFYACSGYPKCKYARSTKVEIEADLLDPEFKKKSTNKRKSKKKSTKKKSNSYNSMTIPELKKICKKKKIKGYSGKSKKDIIKLIKNKG
jgi:DNA topoisomerase-1